MEIGVGNGETAQNRAIPAFLEPAEQVDLEDRGWYGDTACTSRFTLNPMQGDHPRCFGQRARPAMLPPDALGLVQLKAFAASPARRACPAPLG